MPARREDGFTLTELMVVVAILGILAALALPTLSKVVRRDAVRERARAILFFFHEARGEASSGGRAVIVRVRSDASTGAHLTEAYIQPGTACVPGDTSAAAQIARHDIAHSDVSVEGIDPMRPRAANDVWICIKPSGRMYEFRDGVELAFSGELVFDVFDRVQPTGEYRQVRIAMSAQGKVY